MNTTAQATKRATKESPRVFLGKDGEIYCPRTGKTIAVLPYYDSKSIKDRHNQRLLAAAPQLYAALINVMQELNQERRKQQKLTMSETEREAECLIFNIDSDDFYTF